MKVQMESEEEWVPTMNLCSGCYVELKEPYIRCAECECPPCLLCLQCFAKGLELDRHANDHDYEIVRTDFSLWDDDWLAAEEMQLLEAIDDCGLGNWLDISKHMRKPMNECEAHYWHYYVERPRACLLQDLCQHHMRPSRTNNDCDVPIPYRVSEDPPRPVFDSMKHAEMAGYSAARGDFMTEYDNFAEMNLRDLEFNEDDTEMERNLKFAEIDIYINQMKERARRKKIIRNYGIIDVRKSSLLWLQYENTVGRKVLNSLRTLMRLLPPEEFEAFLESMHYEATLRQKISILQEYREVGLKKFASAKLYHELKQRREEEISKRSSALDALAHLRRDGANSQWLARQTSRDHPTSLPLSTHCLPRRAAPPLDIVGLPGYESLNEKERELCSLVRLVPDAYLEFKAILINENIRNGYVKLAQARQLIKIDVNKTRKLYDFLIQEKCICKDAA